MANVKELKRVRAHIRRYPEKFNMNTWVRRPGGWSCGTTACIAGRSALLNGWQPIFGEGFITNTFAKDGAEEDVWVIAEDILDLTYEEADRLFYSGNDHYAEVLDKLIAEYDV